MGKFVGGRLQSFPCSSSFMADATTVKMAVEFALLLPVSRVIIESDCTVVIDAIRDSLFVEWNSSGTLDDISLLVNSFEAIDFVLPF